MLTAMMIMMTAGLITLTTIMIIMIMTTTVLTRTVIIINFVSRALLHRGEGGRKKNPGIGSSRDFQTPRKVKFNKIAL